MCEHLRAEWSRVKPKRAQSEQGASLAHHYYVLILNRFSVSVYGREKAGVAHFDIQCLFSVCPKIQTPASAV
jgi:hypothetical protein